jgi:four helix bundle protein
MDTNSLKARFKVFALAVVNFTDHFQESAKYRTVKNQIIRSATSTAANYRAACRRKSPRDFIAKMGIVEEELDETMFWLEFLVGLSEDWREPITPLWKEADELLAITVTSIKTARNNQKRTE